MVGMVHSRHKSYRTRATDDSWKQGQDAELTEKLTTMSEMRLKIPRYICTAVTRPMRRETLEEVTTVLSRDYTTKYSTLQAKAGQSTLSNLELLCNRKLSWRQATVNIILGKCCHQIILDCFGTKSQDGAFSSR